MFAVAEGVGVAVAEGVGVAVAEGVTDGVGDAVGPLHPAAHMQKSSAAHVASIAACFGFNMIPLESCDFLMQKDTHQLT